MKLRMHPPPHHPNAITHAPFLIFGAAGDRLQLELRDHEAAPRVISLAFFFAVPVLPWINGVCSESLSHR